MTDLHIGELNLTQVLRQHRSEHCERYRVVARELQELEEQVKAKEQEYDYGTQHLRDIDEALRHPDRVRHVSKSGTVRVLADEVDPLHTTKGSAGDPTLHEQVDYFKMLIAKFEREAHPSTDLIEELMSGALAMAQIAEETLTVDQQEDQRE